MAATAILPSAGVGASAPTSTLVSMPATAAAGIYKALQATSTTTSGGVLINRVLAHHIQHSTFATCVHYLRQAAEADQVGQGRVHCICCRKTNSCRFGHGCRFDGCLNGNGVAGATCMQCECPERAGIPCDTSHLHAPCCAAQQLACVPGPKPRRETRDANAEEATGEKQLLRLKRPGRPRCESDSSSTFDASTAFRRDTFPLMAARPPLSTTPYRRSRAGRSVEV